MVATNQKIKDFFALTGNNPIVTNEQLTKLAEAVGARVNRDESPVDADGLVDFIYQELRDITIHHNANKDAQAARAAVTF